MAVDWSVVLDIREGRQDSTEDCQYETSVKKVNSVEMLIGKTDDQHLVAKEV